MDQTTTKQTRSNKGKTNQQKEHAMEGEIRPTKEEKDSVKALLVPVTTALLVPVTTAIEGLFLTLLSEHFFLVIALPISHNQQEF